MQSSFTHHIFTLEQEEYEREQVDFSKITFVDNRECINLIEAASVTKTTFGLAKLLDDELKMPKSTDYTFLEKVRSQHKDHPYYHHDKLSKSSFGIKHYAGVVSYEVEGFLEKNADTIQEELITLLLDSTSPLLSSMFEKEKTDKAEEKSASASVKGISPNSSVRASKAAHKITVAAFFKKELRNLIETLDNCNAHYVRCIKPNAQKEPNNWDSKMVLDQLAYSGMLDTIKIRKAGFPFRQSHPDFCDRYRVLAPSIKIEKDKGKSALEILQKISWDNSSFAIGKTKIFLKEGQAEKLDSLRKDALSTICVKIQAVWRGYSAQKNFQRQKKAVVVFQKYTRRWASRNHFLRIQTANLMGQTVVRTWITRRKFQKSKQAVEDIQCLCLSYLAQVKLSNLRQQEKERLELLAKLEEEERKRMEEERQQNIQKEEEKRRKDEEERRIQAEIEHQRIEEEQRKIEEEKLEKQRQEEMDQLGFGTELATLKHQINRAPSQKKISRSISRNRIRSEKDSSSPSGSFLLPPSSQMHGRSASFFVPPPPSSGLSDSSSLKDDLSELPLPDLNEFLGGSFLLPNTTGNFDIMTDNLPHLLIPPTSSSKNTSPRSSLRSSPRSSPHSKEGSFLDPKDSKEGKQELSLDELGEMVDELKAPEERPQIKTLQEELLESMDVGAGVYDPKPSEVEQYQEETGPIQLRPYGGVIQNVWEDPPEVCMTEEYKNFTWKSYSLKCLAKAKQVKMKMHFKDPWVFSAHPPDSGFFHELSENAKKKGEDIFFSILCYMGDKKTKEKSYDLAYSIAQKGLSTPELRDEIYAALLRQTTNNPNAESNMKGWQLLSIMSCIFPPVNEVLKKTVGAYYISASFQSEIKKIAQFSMQRLRRTLQTGPRRLPPSIKEYERVIGFAPVTVQVRFLDGRTVGFLIDSSSTVAEAMEAIVDRIALRNATGFGLYECFNSIQKKFREENILADSLTKAQSLSRQHKQEIDHYFLFRKCAFTDIKLSFEDPVERELIYGQIHENVVSDELPVSEEICIALASLDLQITVGDWSEERDLSHEFVEQLIPSLRFPIHSVEEWAELVSRAHQTQIGRSREECMLDYLKFCQQLPLYGAEIFVDVCWSKLKPPPQDYLTPEPFVLAINIDGIYFLSMEQKILHNIKFSQIEDYSNTDANNFSLNVNSIALNFVLDGVAPKVDTVLGDYTYFLQLESNWARATQDQDSYDDFLLRFNQGDIIWIKERDPSGWWMGENAQTSQTGSFPAEYVEILVGREATENLGLREITQEDFDSTTLTPEEINASQKRKGIPPEIQNLGSGSTLKVNKIDNSGSKSIIKQTPKEGGILGTIRNKFRSSTKLENPQDTLSKRGSLGMHQYSSASQLELPSSPVNHQDAMGTLRLRSRDSTLKRGKVSAQAQLEFSKVKKNEL